MHNVELGNASIYIMLGILVIKVFGLRGSPDELAVGGKGGGGDGLSWQNQAGHGWGTVWVGWSGFRDGLGLGMVCGAGNFGPSSVQWFGIANGVILVNQLTP
jgi:hypothetical protein